MFEWQLVLVDTAFDWTSYWEFKWTGLSMEFTTNDTSSELETSHAKQK